MTQGHCYESDRRCVTLENKNIRTKYIQFISTVIEHKNYYIVEREALEIVFMVRNNHIKALLIDQLFVITKTKPFNTVHQCEQ